MITGPKFEGLRSLRSDGVAVGLSRAR